MFVSVKFSTIFLGEVWQARQVNYSREYIKKDGEFWKLMDNVSFQTTLLPCIRSIFFYPIKSSFIRFDFFSLLFPCFFLCIFLFLPLFLCFFFYFLLRYATIFFQRFFNSWIFNNMMNLMVHHQNLLHFLKFLPT